jgi:hypothetical protein
MQSEDSGKPLPLWHAAFSPHHIIATFIRRVVPTSTRHHSTQADALALAIFVRIVVPRAIAFLWNCTIEVISCAGECCHPGQPTKAACRFTMQALAHTCNLCNFVSGKPLSNATMQAARCFATVVLLSRVIRSLMSTNLMVVFPSTMALASWTILRKVASFVSTGTRIVSATSSQ